MIRVVLDLMPGNNLSTAGPNNQNRLGSWIGAMSPSNNDQGPDAEPAGEGSARDTAQQSRGGQVQRRVEAWSSSGNLPVCDIYYRYFTEFGSAAGLMFRFAASSWGFVS